MSERAKTSPHGVPIRYPEPRVEFLESDDLAPVEIEDEDTAGRVGAPVRLEREVAGLRVLARAHATSLNLGASRFEQLEARFEALRVSTENEVRQGELKQEAKLHELRPKPQSRLTIAGFVLTVSLTVGGLVWAAARYPERAEFDAVRAKSTELQFTLSMKERDIADLRKALEHVEAEQAATAAKLDQIMVPRAVRP